MNQTPVNQNKKTSLLIVDDEPEILQSLLGLLRREFQLFTATSAEEALVILQDNPVQVIMTDQRMPGMTGVELMQQVREKYPDSIRIVFTGYADIKAVVEAINSGGLYRYITKPWDPDELIDLLRKAAGEYDQFVDQRYLATETREYILQTQALVQSLSDLQLPGNTRPDLQKLTAAGQQLLARLDVLGK
jgi:DNA-binding NtrC family response regulator